MGTALSSSFFSSSEGKDIPISHRQTPSSGLKSTELRSFGACEERKQKAAGITTRRRGKENTRVEQ